jgi:hypothetical protein
MGSPLFLQGIDDVPFYIESDEPEALKIIPEVKYLEMAVGYINDKNYENARRYIRLAQESGDEKIYQDSLIWSMYLDALEGNKNLENQAGTLQGDLNLKALYYISEGWQSYFEKNPEAKDIYLLSIEYKEKLIAKDPESEWALLATMQLVPLFINEKNYDKALTYLLDYLESAKKDSKMEAEEKYWFYMGQILENSREYRDLHKAIKSYQKVVKKPESFFYEQARQRILAIEKFYNITP